MNIASREAAAVPAAIDSLAEYSGVYSTVFLPAANGNAPRNIELTISSSKSGAPPNLLLNSLLDSQFFTLEPSPWSLHCWCWRSPLQDMPMMPV